MLYVYIEIEAAQQSEYLILFHFYRIKTNVRNAVGIEHFDRGTLYMYQRIC